MRLTIGRVACLTAALALPPTGSPGQATVVPGKLPPVPAKPTPQRSCPDYAACPGECSVLIGTSYRWENLGNGRTRMYYINDTDSRVRFYPVAMVWRNGRFDEIATQCYPSLTLEPRTERRAVDWDTPRLNPPDGIFYQVYHSRVVP